MGLAGVGPCVGAATLPGPVLLREGVLDVEVAAVELQGGKPPVVQGHGLLHVGDALTYRWRGRRRRVRKWASGAQPLSFVERGGRPWCSWPPAARAPGLATQGSPPGRQTGWGVRPHVHLGAKRH